MLIGAGVGIVLALGGGGAFAFSKGSAFDESMQKEYATPPLELSIRTDPVTLARGEHLVKAVAACASKNCHGADLSGGEPIKMGPLGTFTGPNLTPGSVISVYKDAELARLIRYGIKKDGRSATFMPSQDFNWLPDTDVAAIIAYMRSQRTIDHGNGPVNVGIIGKIVDRKGGLVLDVARFISTHPVDLAGAPAATPAYGAFLGRLCTGCHGERLSGGPIPGAPKDFPPPPNLTPHETGMAGWTFQEFDRLLTDGIRKNGQKLHPIMPTEAFGKMDATEKQALYAYLMGLAPLPYGGR